MLGMGGRRWRIFGGLDEGRKEGNRSDVWRVMILYYGKWESGGGVGEDGHGTSFYSF